MTKLSKNFRAPETVAPPTAARGSIQSQSEEAPKLRKVERPPPKEPDHDPDNMTEAERAMLEAKRRHEAEQEAKAVENDERRRQELQQVRFLIYFCLIKK